MSDRAPETLVFKTPVIEYGSDTGGLDWYVGWKDTVVSTEGAGHEFRSASKDEIAGYLKGIVEDNKQRARELFGTDNWMLTTLARRDGAPPIPGLVDNVAVIEASGKKHIVPYINTDCYLASRTSRPDGGVVHDMRGAIDKNFEAATSPPRT